MKYGVHNPPHPLTRNFNVKAVRTHGYERAKSNVRMMRPAAAAFVAENRRRAEERFGSYRRNPFQDEEYLERRQAAVEEAQSEMRKTALTLIEIKSKSTILVSPHFNPCEYCDVKSMLFRRDYLPEHDGYHGIVLVTKSCEGGNIEEDYTELGDIGDLYSTRNIQIMTLRTHSFELKDIFIPGRYSRYPDERILKEFGL